MPTVPPVVVAGRMAQHRQPHLQVDELVLRPWTPDDVTALVAAYSDPAIQRWHTRSLTVSEAEDFVSSANRSWTDETGANWAVTDGRAVLGRMSLRTLQLAAGVGDIAYWVMPAARGRRVAPRALSAVSLWALRDLGLHRLELDHSTQNEASCRVATKAGFRLEGTKRSQARHADGWHDMHLHALIESDLPG